MSGVLRAGTVVDCVAVKGFPGSALGPNAGKIICNSTQYLCAAALLLSASIQLRSPSLIITNKLYSYIIVFNLHCGCLFIASIAMYSSSS